MIRPFLASQAPELFALLMICRLFRAPSSICHYIHNGGVSVVRRLRLAPLGLVFALAAASGGVRAAPRGPVPSPPNVLIILTDDERADRDTMSVLSELNARVRGEGRRMRNAFTTTPLCCPARASLMTGQYAHNHGVLTNGHTFELDHETTIQYYLSQNGYSTALFGKYLNKWESDPPYFDTWAYPVATRNPLYYNEDWNIDGEWQNVSQYSTDFITDSAVEHLNLLEKDDERPWFTLLAPMAPHSPADPAERHVKSDVPSYEGDEAFFEKNLSDKPRYVREAKEVDLEETRQLALKQRRSLLAVDDLVKRVDRTLRRLHERSITLVIFLSDNGHNWGAHGLWGRGAAKDTPYTPAIDVPFLMRWPGHVTGGSKDERLVSNVDVAPTILDAADVEPAHTLDGRSLLDLSWDRNSLFIEHFRKTPRASVPDWFSVRTKEAQYIEIYDKQGERAFREFYDLANDPWQLRNLLRIPPPGDVVVDRYEKQLAAGRTCVGTLGPGRCR